MLDRWFMSGMISDKNLFWITEIGGNIMKMNLSNHNIEFINLGEEDRTEDLSSSSMVYVEDNMIYALLNNPYIYQNLYYHLYIF